MPLCRGSAWVKAWQDPASFGSTPSGAWSIHEAPVLTRMLEYSMRRSLRVILLFGFLAVLGAWSAWRSPLDAIPDLSDPQVLLSARLPGSPAQIAEGVTAPMMKRLKALPGVRTVRGFSDLGYSYLT